MKILNFRALVLYQELCPKEPEKELSRGESLDFTTFSELTKTIMLHPDLKINPRVLFKALEGKDITPSSTAGEGDIERTVTEGNIECVLKIKISLQSINWEKLN